MCAQDSGNTRLLTARAPYLERERDRVRVVDESGLRDRLHACFELDLRTKGAPVRDDRLALLPIPHIKLDASASSKKDAAVHVHTGGASELILVHQIRVVARGDEVVRERLVELGLLRSGELASDWTIRIRIKHERVEMERREVPRAQHGRQLRGGVRGSGPTGC